MSSATDQDLRKLYQKFLEEAVKILGKRGNNTRINSDNTDFYRSGKGYETEQNADYNRGFYDKEYYSSTHEPKIHSIEKFNLFESAPRYGITRRNLLFSVRIISILFLFNVHKCHLNNE